MGRENYKVLIILSIWLLSACVKDKPPTRNSIVPSNKSGVYIVCEGQFTAGNASLYLYKPVADSVFGDLFLSANGSQLGDVFQSITAINNKLFLLVNNSDKVIAVNASDLKTTGTINIPSPRYMLPVGVGKAYISSLYHNKIYVVNTEMLSITDSISLPATNTEGICQYGTDVYIACWDTASHYIYKVNPSTDQVIQSINVAGYAPHNILVDKEQMLWVLSGNQAKNRQSYWTRIDPSTGSILATYVFPIAAEPIKPVFNATRDTLYFIEANYYGGTTDNGIYRMDIHAASLPAQPFVGVQQYQYFWALGIDPATGYIFVGDPKGFNQKGVVSVYKPDGTVVKNFSTGVGPGQFYFSE